MKSNPIQHVVDPYVVGGAIIGLKCKDGIVIGADTLLSYGSLLSISFFTWNIRMFAASKK